MIVGLTGPNAAGKGEVADHLARLGFRLHSLSDIVREAARERGLPPEREHLIRIGNELRREGGPGVLAERIMARLGDRDVVDSIRNPTEVEVLRGRRDFVLVGVTAPMELRFARSRSRARPGDPETIEAFRERERQENGRDAHAQRLSATFERADHVLTNDGTLADLRAATEALVDSIGRRPAAGKAR